MSQPWRADNPGGGASSAGAGGNDPLRQEPAWRAWRSILLFAVVVAIGIAADLSSKSFLFDWLTNAPNHSRMVIPGVLRFRLSTNPGIVFGLPVPGWIVFAATLAAAATVIVLFGTSSRRNWGLHLALGMVLAGSIGNGYDRLFARVVFQDEPPHVGEVRDFIDVYAVNYPIFNVADILLVVGVLLIMLHVLRQKPPAGEKATESRA